MMRVACLTPYPQDTVPGQRFRMEQWAKHLAGMGIDMDFVPFLRPETMQYLYKPGHIVEKSRDVLAGCFGRALWSVRKAREYDVVIIQREAILLGVDWIERYLSRHVPTVFDFDDAVWLPNISAANRKVGFLKGFKKIDRILGMVTTVSAGCEYLAAHGRRFNSDVHITPTSIDLATYSPPREHVQRDVLEVGWTGSVTTGPYLKLIGNALAEASKRIKLRLSVLGAEVELPGVDVRCEKWTPEREVPYIRKFDVGLKPMPQEDWVKGKCPMKEIQYMALGIPCIATRYGTSVESIEHGVTGLLCEGDDVGEWVDALVRMNDVETRARMGVLGRRVVQERYSSEVAAAAFAKALESARRRFRATRVVPGAELSASK
jgi:glycosyltransferase involved in cell wall biosynthesis